MLEEKHPSSVIGIKYKLYLNVLEDYCSLTDSSGDCASTITLQNSFVESPEMLNVYKGNNYTVCNKEQTANEQLLITNDKEWKGRVAQWIEHLFDSREDAGSNLSSNKQSNYKNVSVNNNDS